MNAAEEGITALGSQPVDIFRKVEEQAIDILIGGRGQARFLDSYSQRDRRSYEEPELVDLTRDQIPVLIDLLDVLGQGKSAHAMRQARNPRSRNRSIFTVLGDHLLDDPYVLSERQLSEDQLNTHAPLLNLFSNEQLVKVIRTMSRLRISHTSLLAKIGRDRLHKEKLTAAEAADLARAYGALGYRHDTMFKKWTKELIAQHENRKHGKEDQYEFTTGHMASILEAMILCKRHRGATEWWDAETDFKDLIEILAKRLLDDLHTLNPAEVASAAWTLGKVRYVDDALSANLLRHLGNLLTNPDVDDGSGNNVSIEEFIDTVLASKESELTPKQIQELKEIQSREARASGRDDLERTLDGIVHMGKGKKKTAVDVEWVTQWACQNVYNISFQEVVRINRWLADLGYSEHSYYEIFVPFFLDNIEQATRDDVKHIADTYNKVKLDDEKLGRHFFYTLGKRFQQEHVAKVGVRSKIGGVTRIG